MSAAVSKTCRLPVQIYGATDAEFEALGFILGAVCVDDPLFRDATIPDGWRFEETAVAGWWRIVDERGRMRVAIGMDAQQAHRALYQPITYVRGCVESGRPIVTDEVWATRAAAATAARAAAEWWAAIVTGPAQVRIVDEASRTRGTDFVEVALMTIAARTPAPESAAVTGFIALLEARVAESLARQAGWKRSDCAPAVSLSVDYGPDLDLAECADQAGLRCAWPPKTRMSVTLDYMTASTGYRAPTRLVWQAPDWQRPGCSFSVYGDQGQIGQICALLRFHDGPCQPAVAGGVA